jgi:hypothetical protein
MPPTIVRPRTGRKRRQTPRCTVRKRRALLLYEMKCIQRRSRLLLVLTIVGLIRIRRLRREQDNDNQESIARLDRLSKITLLFAMCYRRKYLALLWHKDELLTSNALDYERLLARGRHLRSPTSMSSREKFLDYPMPCRLDLDSELVL